MKRVLFFLVVASLAGSALAQPRMVASGLAFTLAPPPPPAVASWRLATASNQFVELVTPPLTYASPLDKQFQITPANAAQFGVDWAGWSSAIKNPAYNRSIVTFGSATQETTFGIAPPNFQLDQLFFFVHRYTASSTVDLTMGGIQFGVVPEPASWVLLAVATCLTAMRWPFRKPVVH